MDEALRFADEHAEGEIAATALCTTRAVRSRCGQLLARARAGGSPWFEVDDEACGRALQTLVEALRRPPARAFQRRSRTPRPPVPLHSFWRHLEAGGIDGRFELDRSLAGSAAPTRHHACIDLALVGALLGFPGDPGWRYTEPATGQALTGDPALAVATFHAFRAGLFSSDPQRPLQVDAAGLRGVIADRLAQALQVYAGPVRDELARRAIRLRRLGELLYEQPEVFGDDGRPAGVFDIIVTPYGHGVPHTADVDAHDILSQLITTLPDLWPGGGQIGGVALGDCWPHPAVRADGPSDGWVPFHTLMQWLTYSQLEPFAWAGAQVRGTAGLTALADRHHAQQLLDLGVLRLRDPDAAEALWQPGDELIVEWRALTVALLEDIAARAGTALRFDDPSRAMACILADGMVAGAPAPPQHLQADRPRLRLAPEAPWC